MKRRITTVLTLSLGIFVCSAMNSAGAQEKKAKEAHVTGRVQMIDRGKSTITVMSGTTPHQVIYNSGTQWMQGTQASNKPSSIEELKENWYINCKGTHEVGKLVASACRFRESK